MWTVRLKRVPERVNQLAVSINGKIYSFYSYDSGLNVSNREPINVYVFNPVSYHWDLLQTQYYLPNGTRSDIVCHAVVAYEDCAYIWATRGNPELRNILYRFDTKTMTWSRPNVSGQRPEVRCGYTACLVGHRVYIFGGLPPYTTPLPSIDFLDLKTLQWHRVPTSGDIPRRRIFHSASAIGSRMYIWGGHSADLFQVYDRTLFFLDTATLTWVRPRVNGPPPAAREDHAAFVYKGELYIFGGMDYDLLRYFGDLHKYNPENSCWSQVRPRRSGPSSRRYLGCCVLDERVFFFSGVGLASHAGNRQGMQDEEQELSDMHVLDFAPTLKTLCLLALIETRLNVDRLPPAIRREVVAITTHSS
ncbi:hypothetical protein V5799_012530 [Amblyomma americanum]|uniref:Kelch domain-containing protein 3 n=1 Tax=Amblyomma americanum TaxID=6943 RepID=A0AAQ4EDU7_AMBAM